MEQNKFLDAGQLKEVEAKIKETKEKLEKFVRENPLTSVALALSMGYLIARLLEKGRRE